ncbi:hypothetical protein D1007_55503 [Hordeum vulgare]|nr:hypothetical protein D1007_55503 [Hordeum vulgare]
MVEMTRSTATAASPTPHASVMRGDGSTMVAARRELAVRRHVSSGSCAAVSSSAGTSSLWRITPVKREPEDLGPLVIKLEADADPSRRGVIDLEDYLPPGQEDHLVHSIMKRSVRKVKEADACIRCELEIEEIFEQGFAVS